MLSCNSKTFWLVSALCLFYIIYLTTNFQLLLLTSSMTEDSKMQELALYKPDDPLLIGFIRDRVMLYPKDYKNTFLDTLAEYHINVFSTDEPIHTYNVKEPGSNVRVGCSTGQYRQPLIVDEVLGGIHNGFYIEAGAWDGRQLSNSMFFEWHRNWTGLLVEPNKDAFRILVTEGFRNNSVAVNGCLAVTNHTQQLMLHPASVYGGLEDKEHLSKEMNERMNLASKNRQVQPYPVICYPLYSMLLALERTEVDFFSLDVEGAELSVLKTIPFQKVKFKVLLVEVVFSQEKELIQFMDSVGYKVLKRLRLDLLFVPK